MILIWSVASLAKCNFLLNWIAFTEDAKRMSIKEEQVDPEYENCDRGREEARQGPSHCSISNAKKEGGWC